MSSMAFGHNHLTMSNIFFVSSLIDKSTLIAEDADRVFRELARRRSAPPPAARKAAAKSEVKKSSKSAKPQRQTSRKTLTVPPTE